MKRIIFSIAIILTTILTYSQAPTDDSTKYVWYKYQYGMRLPRIASDSFFLPPYGDTTGRRPFRNGALMVYSGDKKLYKWDDISGWGSVGAAIQISDTSFIIGSDTIIISGTQTLPGGSDTQFQINNDGTFGGTTGMTWDNDNTGATIRKDDLGSTPSLTTGLLLENKTSATSGMQQYSPGIWFKGQGWKTGSGGGSQEVMYHAYLRPTQGSITADADLVFHKYINGSPTNTAGFTIEREGIRIHTGLVSGGGGISLNANATPLQNTIATTSNLKFSSNNISSGTLSIPIYWFYTPQVINTSGLINHVMDTVNFFPSSGDGQYNGFVFRPRIEQTGTASGISRGFYANPDIVNAADFRAFESETGRVIFNGNSLGTTQTNSAGVLIANNTAAGPGAQQISPALRWRGYGWKTDATAASQPIDFRAYVIPVQGTTSPTGSWQLQSAVNDGSYSTRMLVNSNAITGEFMSGGLRLSGGGLSFAATPVANNFTWGAATFNIGSTSTTATAQDVLTFFGTGTGTSGITNFTRYNQTFSPTSGTGEGNIIEISPTVNQTGGSSGATRGLYVNPTLTSAADFRAIETNAGSVIFKGTAGDFLPLLKVSVKEAGLGDNPMGIRAIDSSTGGGYAIHGTSLNNIGVLGSGTVIGVHGTSTGGTAVQGSTQSTLTSPAVQAIVYGTNETGNTVIPGINIRRGSMVGGLANGAGSKITFQSAYVSGGLTWTGPIDVNKIESVATDINGASFTTDLMFTGIADSVEKTYVTIKGGGQVQLNTYDTGFAVNDTTNYKPLAIDSEGKVYKMQGWSGLTALKGTTTWDPSSIGAGSNATTTMSVTGAELGDPVTISKTSGSYSNGEIYDAFVSVAGTVTIRLTNASGGTFDITEANYNVIVLKY